MNIYKKREKLIQHIWKIAGRTGGVAHNHASVLSLARTVVYSYSYSYSYFSDSERLGRRGAHERHLSSERVCTLGSI